MSVGWMTEDGKNWRDKGLRWASMEHSGKDGYTSIASQIVAHLDL